MSFGQTLRAAREAKGLTTSELAARTHLLIQIVEGLENEDFRRIPAPIYGRGFVKLYCETVGLDPKPLQAEFMSLYSRGKDAPPKVPQPSQSAPPKVNLPTPPVPPEPAAAPEPAQEPPAQEPPNISEHSVPERPAALELPTQEPPPIGSEPPASEQPITDAAVSEPPAPPEPPPRRSYGELFEQTYADDEPEKPSAAEKFRDTMSNVSHGVFANVKKLPPNTGRIVMVAVGTFILIAMIAWGIAALYKATSPQPAPESPVVADPADKTAAKPGTRPTKREAGSTKTSLPTKQEAGSTKTSLPTKREAGSTKTSLPTKRASASGEGKPTSAKSGTLKASGIDIPSLYID